MEHELLKIREVAELLRVSLPTMHRLIKANQVPAPIRLGNTSLRWRADDLREFLQNKPRTNEEAQAPAEPATA